MSLEVLNHGTKNFSECNCIGKGRFWKLYEGEVAHANRCTHVTIKRWDRESPHAHVQFWTELDCLFKYKHENIVALVGYCNEMDEKIIVYEHASNGKLNKHLCNPCLTWMERLKISLDVAKGLEFVHKAGIVHGDIKSDGILLDDDWNAKFCNLEVSFKINVVERAEHIDGDACNSLGYVDPKFQTMGFLGEKSDIYSLGVILIEMLCGRLAWVDGCEDHSQSLGPSAVRHYKEHNNLDEMIFEGIKEQIAPPSLIIFADVALKCLEDIWDHRPEATDVVIQLKRSLNFQEDYEIWEPKMPTDYKNILEMSKNSEINNSMKTKKDLYDMFSNGILLQDNKVLFSLGSDGERNEMISARKFLYKNHTSHKWRSVPESRFPKVLKMLDSSSMKIQIKIRTQFLSPCINYKVLLIFRFCSARKSQAKLMYVNLKYKMGNESLHAYHATWREDGWMMIELFRFLNHKADTDFEVFLESFSRCYCGIHSVYIEGIQFKAVDNVTYEESNKLKEAQQVLDSKSNTDSSFSLSAKEVVCTSSSLANQSRLSGEIELQRQQVFHVKCKIESQMLSANNENVCYLVFKLSDRCSGLHGPVIVRNLSHSRRNSSKEPGILYFRTQNNPWNLHNTDWLPQERNDGWMEVVLWKFNSNDELQNDGLFVHLKLITYEGTMEGLILHGIEFR